MMGAPHGDKASKGRNLRKCAEISVCAVGLSAILRMGALACFAACVIGTSITFPGVWPAQIFIKIHLITRDKHAAINRLAAIDTCIAGRDMAICQA